MNPIAIAAIIISLASLAITAGFTIATRIAENTTQPAQHGKPYPRGTVWIAVPAECFEELEASVRTETVSNDLALSASAHQTPSGNTDDAPQHQATPLQQLPELCQGCAASSVLSHPCLILRLKENGISGILPANSTNSMPYSPQEKSRQLLEPTIQPSVFPPLDDSGSQSSGAEQRQAA